MQDLIFSPSEADTYGYNALKELQSNRGKGVKTGIVDLDRVLKPLLPGDLCSVLGYTSWYKTGFLNWLLRAGCEQCKSDEIVIKVTWEDAVEEDTIKWYAAETGLSISELIDGNVDWELINLAYKKRLDIPLWIVGHANTRSYAAGKARPRMTMTNVLGAIEFITDGFTNEKYRPRLIVLDYLQRIRPDAKDGNNKREQMMEAVNKSKDLAIQLGCPVVLGVQASREVLERTWKLPKLDDGLETSNIEQSSDKVLSLWYPIKTEKPDAKIEGIEYRGNENLLICGILKQKLGKAPVTFPLYVNPERGIISCFERSV